MMIYPSMLVSAAAAANMKVPTDPDNFDGDKYPHFDVFCKVQLGRRVVWGEHWENAKVVASIPKDKIKSVYLEDLIHAGLRYSS